MSAAVIPLCPRIRALFGRRPRIAELAVDVEIPPIPPARPIRDGDDARPCDTEPAA